MVTKSRPAATDARPIDFGWFLPTMGDAEIIGPPTREATLEYLVDVTRAAEDAGFNFALLPVGTTCMDAWLAAGMVGARTERLKFLVAMRPGFVSRLIVGRPPAPQPAQDFVSRRAVLRPTPQQIDAKRVQVLRHVRP